MGIISSAMLHSWEEMGCLDNDNSEELEQLKAENDKLRTCLQEIKAIAEADVHIVGDEKFYYDVVEQILQKIAESEVG